MTSKAAIGFLCALLFATKCVYIARGLAFRFDILDVPNARSSHDRPVPRVGGLGLLVGIILAVISCKLLGQDMPNWPFWAGLSIMACTGLWDDIRGGLRVSTRLLAQGVAASLVVFFSGRFLLLPLPSPADIALHGFSYLVSILWIMAVINFFNFMDGIDGLAGTQSFIAGLALAVTAPGDVACLGSVVAGASLGFLFFNWQPAKVFLGDVGSYSLGFIFAAIPFINGNSSAHSLTILIGLLLWMFLSDASLTLVRRLIEKEPVWEAHRSHYYQRMVRSGVSHAHEVLIMSAFSATVSATAVFAYRRASNGLLWLAVLVAISAAISHMIIVRIMERATSQKKP